MTHPARAVLSDQTLPGPLVPGALGAPDLPEAIAPAPAAAPARKRDLRIDAARGLAMLLITITHTNGHKFSSWVPAQASVSDTADVFVVLAGLVAGMVFVPMALRRGFGAMCLRVIDRVRRILMAQVATVLITALLAVAIGLAFPGLKRDFLTVFPIGPLFERPLEALIGLATLTWLPHNFDILPMYVVLIGSVPLLIATQRYFGLMAVAGLVLGAYALAQLGFNLRSQPWNPEAHWLFNPFAWTLPFATAFAFGAGWIPTPRITGRLALLALLYLLILLPFTFWPISLGVWIPGAKQVLAPVSEFLGPLTVKSSYGFLRLGSVFSVLVIGAWLAGPDGRRLREGITPPPIADATRLGTCAFAVLILAAVLRGGAGPKDFSMIHATSVVMGLAIALIFWCVIGPTMRAHTARHALPALSLRLARIGRNSLGCFVVSTPMAMIGVLLIDLTAAAYWSALLVTGLYFVVFDAVSAAIDRAAAKASPAYS